jgi:hypothetical protein
MPSKVLRSKYDPYIFIFLFFISIINSGWKGKEKQSWLIASMPFASSLRDEIRRVCSAGYIV